MLGLILQKQGTFSGGIWYEGVFSCSPPAAIRAGGCLGLRGFASEGPRARSVPLWENKAFIRRTRSLMLGLFKQLRVRAGFVSEQNGRKSTEQIEQARLPTCAAPFVQTHPQALLQEGSAAPPELGAALLFSSAPSIFLRPGRLLLLSRLYVLLNRSFSSPMKGTLFGMKNSLLRSWLCPRGPGCSWEPRREPWRGALYLSLLRPPSKGKEWLQCY